MLNTILNISGPLRVVQNLVSSTEIFFYGRSMFCFSEEKFLFYPGIHRRVKTEIRK